MKKFEFEVHITKRQTINIEEVSSEDAIEKVASMLDDMKVEVTNLVNADIHNFREVKTIQAKL
tara:strand:- start:843 stop:1031 length:189 start_codon:yes stop_codon:yes gene_type:complete